MEGKAFTAQNDSVLKSMAYYKAIGTIFLDRRFAIPKKEYLPGIFVFDRLNK